jgi:hypothetical protein
MLKFQSLKFQIPKYCLSAIWGRGDVRDKKAPFTLERFWDL